MHPKDCAEAKGCFPKSMPFVYDYVLQTAKAGLKTPENLLAIRFQIKSKQDCARIVSPNTSSYILKLKKHKNQTNLNSQGLRRSLC